MSRLRVDCGRGMREEVQVQPNTTLGYVLEEVCKRRKLDPTSFQLQHSLAGKRRSLEDSLTVRFAGLSGNATLELVEASGPVVHGECTVAVQLESGTRETARLSTSSTLAEVAARLGPDVASPLFVYMGRSVSGESLASTTLRTLGVTPGSVRTLSRPSVERQRPSSTWHAAALRLTPRPASPLCSAVCPPSPLNQPRYRGRAT